jgi:hypothetical protein
MRWERLFADLEARFEAAEGVIAEGQLTDLVRAERGQLTIQDRLRAHVGESLTWSVGSGAAPIEGELLDVGADWVLVRGAHGEVLIPITAVQYISGLSRAAHPTTGEVARRLGLGVVLRGLSRDRAAVIVGLPGDQRLTGTIDRVGADHFDLAVHGDDVPRRSAAVRGVRCLLFQSIVSVAVR